MKPQILAAILLTTTCALGATTPRGHEPLRVKNTFKTPEEVVQYYCARDASGFVWTGLLDSERKAFTLWEHPPQHDAFYVASKYEINPNKIRTIRGNDAEVEVRYQLNEMADANGTRVPLTEKTKTVTFRLKKIAGSWKISEPKPEEIAPVILESKFPLPKTE